MDDSNVVKLFKATVYIVYHGNYYKTIDELMTVHFDHDFVLFDNDVALIHWSDDIDINNGSAKKNDYEKYFQVNEMTLEEVEKALGYKVKIIG